MAVNDPRNNGGRSQAEIDLAWAKIHAVRTIAEKVWIPFTVLASALPIWAMRPLVDAIAGEATLVEIVLSVPVLGGGGVAVTINIIGGFRLYHQRQELLRLRERCQKLEDKLRGLGGDPG